MPPPTLAPIPPLFTARKTAILSSLSTPQETYTDSSPKGSVDEAIRPLIERLNRLEGIVTTSSCAGRVSVFLEGRKKRDKKKDRKEGNGSNGKREYAREEGCGGRDDDGLSDDDEEDAAQSTSEDLETQENPPTQTPVPGGKGHGGKWLFVSHSPIILEYGWIARQIGLETLVKGGGEGIIDKPLDEIRVARLMFEPMILHILCATLHHARPLLAAALNAGFRESGIQSLKNLDDPLAFPMLAIRSSGLAFQSVVGVLDCEEEGDYLEPDGIVGEECLELLVRMANARFKDNEDRVRRFEREVFGCFDGGKGEGWEDAGERRERMRREGLERRRDGGGGGEEKGKGDEDGNIEIGNFDDTFLP